VGRRRTRYTGTYTILGEHVVVKAGGICGGLAVGSLGIFVDAKGQGWRTGLYFLGCIGVVDRPDGGAVWQNELYGGWLIEQVTAETLEQLLERMVLMFQRDHRRPS
jgi:hypothetical protein